MTATRPETRAPEAAGVATLWSDDLGHAERISALVALVEQQLDVDWTGTGSRLDQICHYAVLPGNKLFRPMLLLESAGVVGGDLTQVVPAAAGAEAGHVASLIHDDIIDGDQVRRGRPAVHAAYGRDDAIVAGDSLIFYLFASLAACAPRGVPEERVAAAMTVVAEAGLDLCRGQSMEAELCADYRCNVPDYITMIRLKTSALFQAACRSGALLAGGAPEQVEALGQYGDRLGVAFQIWDDLLAYTSDTAAMAKAATSDLTNQRLTLPFLLARELGGPAVADELDDALRGEGDLETRMRFLTGTVHAVGAVEASIAMARDYAQSARDALAIFDPSASRSTLDYFAHAAVDRCK